MYGKVTMKMVAILTLICFTLMLGVDDCVFAAKSVQGEKKELRQNAVAEQKLLENQQGGAQGDNEDQSIYIAKEQKSGINDGENSPLKKKRFPWLLVIGGAVVVGVLVYFLVLKKPEYTLTATVGQGAIGSPTSGQTKYQKGSKVPYSYSLQSGYKDLVVTLDGATVSASGSVVMNDNHTLTVSTSAVSNYMLTVNKGMGVNGTPETGSYTYTEGTSVSWSYNLQSGYQDLVVTLDRTAAKASGSVIMNGNHSLDSSSFVPLEFPFANWKQIIRMAAFGIPNWSGNQPHNGIDLQVNASAVIISPNAGTVDDIKINENPYSNPAGQLMVSVSIYINSQRTVSLVFEPSTTDAGTKAKQIAAIAVKKGDKVLAGTVVGTLLVGELGYPHLHFMLWDSAQGALCAYGYSSKSSRTIFETLRATLSNNNLPDGKICYGQ